MGDVDVVSGTCGSRIGSDRIGSDQRNVVLLVAWIPCLPPACVVCDAAALLLLYIVFDSLYDLDTFFFVLLLLRPGALSLCSTGSGSLSLALALSLSLSLSLIVLVCLCVCAAAVPPRN